MSLTIMEDERRRTRRRTGRKVMETERKEEEDKGRAKLVSSSRYRFLFGRTIKKLNLFMYEKIGIDSPFLYFIVNFFFSGGLPCLSVCQSVSLIACLSFCIYLSISICVWGIVCVFVCLCCESDNMY